MPRVVFNSWAQAILLPWPSKVLGLEARSTMPCLDKNVLIMILVIIIQLSKYTKDQRIEMDEWHGMESNLNRVLIKNKTEVIIVIGLY